MCGRTGGVAGPSAAVDRLGRLLGLAAHDARGLLAGYGGGEGRTRRDHRALVLARLGWQASIAGDRKQPDAFLLARALGPDAPQFHCSWPAIGCATSALLARRWR